jgi:chromosome segregation ATPase
MTLGWSGRVAFAFAVVALVAAAIVTVAGQRPTMDTSIESLVLELRALRIAVERSVAVAAQAQMVVARLQVQESRLGLLGRQAQDARMRLQEAVSRVTSMQSELAGLSKRLEQVESVDERRAIESEIPRRRSELKQAQARVDQLREEDTAATYALTSEQSRWTDINERLEALERAVAASIQRER